MKTKVIKLSICSCGFQMFNDDVKLGTEYDVDWNKQVPGSVIICGGCKTKIPSTFIWVHYRLTNNGGIKLGGYMPKEAFDL